MYFCKQIYVRLHKITGKEEVDDIDGERIKMPKLKSRHIKRHMHRWYLSVLGTWRIHDETGDGKP